MCAKYEVESVKIFFSFLRLRYKYLYCFALDSVFPAYQRHRDEDTIMVSAASLVGEGKDDSFN